MAKLFDNSDQALHINKIVNFTEDELKHLTVDAFKEYNKDQKRKFLEGIAERYKGIQSSDLKEIKEMLVRQQAAIEKLKIYRDKWLAHDDRKKPELPGINATEIKTLFSVLRKILNTISGRLNSETWIYGHAEKNAKGDVQQVIDHIRRFEPYRLAELEKGKKLD